MRQLFLTILILFQLGSFAQTDSSDFDFSHKVLEVYGDLNQDQLLDKAVVTQDTLNVKAPYRLQIYFQEANGQSKLIVTSTKIIEPQYPDGRDGYSTGDGFEDLTIKNGILSVNFRLLRGHYEHKFRYQNENFELIGFSSVQANGHGVGSAIDFNLSTGIRIEKEERCDTDKLISLKTEKILIRPLPKLQDIEPLMNDLY